jgi:hypothetical protein
MDMTWPEITLIGFESHSSSALVILWRMRGGCTAHGFKFAADKLVPSQDFDAIISYLSLRDDSRLKKETKVCKCIRYSFYNESIKNYLLAGFLGD